MSQNLRHPEILDLARREARVTVDGLAAHFGVTVQTVRRDLTELAEAGRLERVHGGAVLPSGRTNIRYEERRALNEDAKRRIGVAAAAHVPSGSSIFLNIGTTTEAVARALVHHENLLVVTNNLNVAEILSHSPDCEVVLTGGRLRAGDNGLVGPVAAQVLAGYKLDLAIIGCSALDEDGDMLDFDMDEVMVSQAALAGAREAMLVCDHSKLSRKAPVKIASLEAVSRVVTDSAFSKSSRMCALQHDCALEVTEVA